MDSYTSTLEQLLFDPRTNTRELEYVKSIVIYATADEADAYMFRPPVRSNGRSYKMLVMFLFVRRQISELPRPIAAKLRHMIGTCVNFIN